MQCQFQTFLQRFANAIASLNLAPKEVTWKVGVDVLCFGGSKNGMPLGEAIVFFNRELSQEFAWRCKQAGQLASKMRFLSAPWVGMLSNDVWLEHAQHANRCAQRLAATLQEIGGVKLLFPVEANAVFVELQPAWIAAMRERKWFFYTFIGEGGARLMCSWATTDETIDAFVSDLRDVIRGA